MPKTQPQIQISFGTISNERERERVDYKLSLDQFGWFYTFCIPLNRPSVQNRRANDEWMGQFYDLYLYDARCTRAYYRICVELEAFSFENYTLKPIYVGAGVSSSSLGEALEFQHITANPSATKLFDVLLNHLKINNPINEHSTTPMEMETTTNGTNTSYLLTFSLALSLCFFYTSAVVLLFYQHIR